MDQKRVCWFYNKKPGCKKKEKCKFLHLKYQPRKKKICFYFLRGNCLFNENCWNYHESQRPQCIREKIVVESNKQKKERLQLKHEVQKVKHELRRVKKLLSTLLNKERSNQEKNENKLVEDNKANKGFQQAINNMKDNKIHQNNAGKKEEKCLKMDQKKENPVKEINAENYAQQFPKIGQATDKTLQQSTIDQKDGYEIYIDYITRGFWEKKAKEEEDRAGKIPNIPVREVNLGEKSFPEGRHLKSIKKPIPYSGGEKGVKNSLQELEKEDRTMEEVANSTLREEEQCGESSQKNFWLSFKKNYGAKVKEESFSKKL